MRRDILENANTYTLSDFQKLKLAESYRKLYSDTIFENAQRKQEKYDKKIYNLSIKNLFENFFSVWTQIINEMTTLIYDNDNNKSWNNYIRIFTKNERIIYVGIMFVFAGLIMYFIFLTR
jgi:hypothetical protein